MALVCTQAERDALAKAIKSGTLQVSFNDKSVRYHDLAAMRAVLNEMDEYLTPSTFPDRFARVSFSRD
jgi:hypothetical protein